MCGQNKNNIFVIYMFMYWANVFNRAAWLRLFLCVWPTLGYYSNTTGASDMLDQCNTYHAIIGIYHMICMTNQL